MELIELAETLRQISDHLQKGVSLKSCLENASECENLEIGLLYQLVLVNLEDGKSLVEAFREADLPYQGQELLRGAEQTGLTTNLPAFFEFLANELEPDWAKSTEASWEDADPYWSE